MPDGATGVNWQGDNYYHHDGDWYSPYWHDDAIWYRPIYPPIGWFASSIDWDDDEEVTTVVIDNTTYYESDGVYYEQTTQDGQEGYEVVEAPEQATITAEEGLPDPFAVLKSGLAYLATQPHFTMAVSDTYDEVSESGQKVSFTSQRNVMVRRPSNVVIEYRGEGESRRVVLDGKELTIVDRTKQAFGRAPMPPTIDSALDELATKYGIVVAVAELLRTDLHDRVLPAVQTGQYLGKDTIEGVECDHLGFTTAETDWEAWFQTGSKPLLRKFSIAYRNVPSRPRYSMLITKYDPTYIPDNLLAAEIPMGAQQVNLTPGGAQNVTTRPAGT